MEDFIFQTTIGMTKEEFLRKAGLMRNPKNGHCPICKKPIITNEQNDVFCSDYGKSNGCYWHRYADGLNYWSSPEECFAKMAETDPEFAKIYAQAKKG